MSYPKAKERKNFSSKQLEIDCLMILTLLKEEREGK